MSRVCVQHLCSNERREGEWLRSLDVVLRRHADATGDDDGLYLHVVDRYPAVRDCITNDENASAVPKTNVRKAPPNHECAAVRRSCLRIIEDHDIDLAEFAFAHQHSMNRSKVTNKLCYELNPGICSAGRKLPADLNFTGYLSKLSSDAGQDGGGSGDDEDMLDGSTDDENRLRLSPFVMLNKEAYDMEKMMMDMQVRFVILAGDALCADPRSRRTRRRRACGTRQCRMYPHAHVLFDRLCFCSYLAANLRFSHPPHDETELDAGWPEDEFRDEKPRRSSERNGPWAMTFAILDVDSLARAPRHRRCPLLEC